MAHNARKKKSRKHNRPRPGMQSHRGPADTAAPAEIPMAMFILGLVGLAAAIVGSGMLAVTHLSGITPPGCGPGSGCADAARSVWGSIPLLEWPTSHAGLAIFLGLTAAWIATRHRGVTEGFTWLVRIGLLISIVLVMVMFANGYVCQWCMVAHGGNLLFWIAVELSRRQVTAGQSLGVRTAVGGAILITAVLIPVELVARQSAQQQVEQQREQSVEEVVTAPESEREAFTGRYLYGPEEAALRVVAFTDYQCEDCQRFERELRDILEQRDDVSLSIKQFPMSNKCNKYLPTNMHANACAAARAAEAAGILQGNDGFWKLHFWLFDDGGNFSPSLPEDLRELGFDPDEFFKVMNSDRTLELVQQDIEEGYNLGLHFTPMVFINGIEVRNAHLPGNFTKIIEQIAARDPEPMTPEEAIDTPPTAREKYVNDWDSQRAFPVPEDTHAYPRGAEEPTVDIVVWGDHQEPITRQHDRIIRARMMVQDGIRYNFRFYPMNRSCNEYMDRVMHDQACVAARAVEAAGLIGGKDAWWSMHEALFANQDVLAMNLIVGLAEEQQLDRDEFIRNMQSTYCEEAIAEDVLAGKQRGLRGIPTIIINGKKLPRLTVGGEQGLPFILNHLLGEAPADELEAARQQLDQQDMEYRSRQKGGRTFIPINPQSQ